MVEIVIKLVLTCVCYRVISAYLSFNRVLLPFACLLLDEGEVLERQRDGRQEEAHEDGKTGS